MEESELWHASMPLHDDDPHWLAGIPCDGAQYSGEAGSCTCAAGYIGSVEYTEDGKLGGCTGVQLRAVLLWSGAQTYTHVLAYLLTA